MEAIVDSCMCFPTYMRDMAGMVPYKQHTASRKDQTRLWSIWGSRPTWLKCPAILCRVHAR